MTDAVSHGGGGARRPGGPLGPGGPGGPGPGGPGGPGGADGPRIEPAVLEHFRAAGSILFVTGAGLSADSGLPTYRGLGGLYDGAATAEGFAIEDALSGAMLRRRPEICWKYLLQIERACRGARPNRGHEVMAAFEREKARVWVLTQNVDAFHRAAGSAHVIEIHGRVGPLSCMRCDWTHAPADWAGLEVPPRCPRCEGTVRPAVVLFGERLPGPAVRDYERALAQDFDLVVSVGTTSVFPYIAGPVVEARRRGVPTVEINPGETEVSHLVHHRVQAGAAAALGAIWEALHPAG